MDINKYIASGILEQYVLGDLSLEEQSQVQKYMAEFPEIKSEVNAIEDALENLAEMTKVVVPFNLEQSILKKLEEPTPAPPNNPPPPLSRTNSGFNLLSGGLLLGLLASLAWGFFQNTNYSSSQSELQELNTQYTQLKEDCAKIKSSTNQYNEQLAFLRDTDTKHIHMKGTDLSKESLTVLYWNQAKNNAYLDIASLPTPPSDKQYQLWAIVDGKPVDAGVFDLTKDILKIPFIENPQAFAITLENVGGVESPTLDQMYVIGNNS